MSHKKTILSTAAVALFLAAGLASSAPIVKPVDIGTFIKDGRAYTLGIEGAFQITDRTGEHLLTLTREEEVSPSRPNKRRLDYTKLTVEYFKHVGKYWEPEWKIQDFLDCPDEDHVAKFLIQDVTVTDVNNDGRAEVTVPYHMLCSGAIEPQTLKVIMREGQAKYAVRGTSLVRFPGQAPIGGARKFDASLDAAENEVYRAQLDAVWKRVVSRVQDN